MKLGINACRARSGGAKAHLIGILSEGNPVAHGFTRIHVWSYRELLDALPSPPWLVKHCPSATDAAMPWQLWWERFTLPRQINVSGCNLLLNVDAGTVCRYRPAVTMSRDMLAFEPGEAARFGLSKARLRQVILRSVQCRSLMHADASIFLTEYASKVIQQCCGSPRALKIIPHGVSEDFKRGPDRIKWPDECERPIRIFYVSPIMLYKHQWHVVRGVEMLRAKGFDVLLTLIGEADDAGLRLLKKQCLDSDPGRVFVDYVGPVPHSMVKQLLGQADIFVFASSCENMPNSLIEAMSCGLPIACSDRGPMPEVLKDGGVFFDPERPDAIASAVERIVTDPAMRERIAKRAFDLSCAYSWKRCAEDTFSFLAQTARLNVT